MNEININIEGYNVNGICVGCLNYNRRMFYNSAIKECFRLLANIDVPDGLEIQVCWECLARVKSAIKFRSQLLKSYDFLIKYSKEHTFLDSPHDFEPYASNSLFKTQVTIEQVKVPEGEEEEEKEALVKKEEQPLEYSFDVDHKPFVPFGDMNQKPFNMLWDYDNHLKAKKSSDTPFEDETNETKPQIFFKLEDMYDDSRSESSSPTLTIVMPSDFQSDSEVSPNHTGLDFDENASTPDTRNHQEWLDDERKGFNNLGKNCIKKRSKEGNERTMGPPCQCRYKCFEKISEEQRLECFKQFSLLGNRVQQWNFIIKYTERLNKKRCTNMHSNNHRKYTYKYYLPIFASSSEVAGSSLPILTSSSEVAGSSLPILTSSSEVTGSSLPILTSSSEATSASETDCEKVLVCYIMFINTLAASETTVRSALTKYYETTILEDRRVIYGFHGIDKKISVYGDRQIYENSQAITYDSSIRNKMYDPFTEDFGSKSSLSPSSAERRPLLNKGLPLSPPRAIIGSSYSSPFSLKVSHSMPNSELKYENLREGYQTEKSTAELLTSIPSNNSGSICDTQFSPHTGVDIAQNSLTTDTKAARKRERNREEWRDVKRKRLKNLGKKYIMKSGKIVGEKKMGPPCGCRNKCYEHITEEQRLECFKRFWDLGDRVLQWNFILNNTQKFNKKRCTKMHNKNQRKYTFKYYLPILPSSSEVTYASEVTNSSEVAGPSNDTGLTNRTSSSEPLTSSKTDVEKIIVCYIMFSNTLAISETTIKTAWSKYKGTPISQDGRGRHANHKIILDTAMRNSVCDHVQTFLSPKSPCNKDQIIYLYDLNFAKMFRMYLDWFDPKKYSSKATILRHYREIVHSHFNIVFDHSKRYQ
ncbi:uncharacterized protein LOC118281186 isoform X1 [Spodoptera frugiperda]|uniref:Uncharacterized protein LOC118281186 isoform X1 n=1 Tax=Spodoptera frugiperda TaxID=7108 RepID=A0A9R0EYZ2_SPOFR|nr:uncharacterized protein LOC118281186 isoform X1 [Spodoptera frugiperda]